MKLGFVTSALPEFNYSKLTEIAASERLGGMEVQAFPQTRDMCDIYGHTQFDWQQPTIPDDVLAIGYYPNWVQDSVDNWDRVITHTKHLLGLAACHGTPFSTHIGADNSLSIRKNLDIFLERFKPISDYAEDIGVKIGIETSTFLAQKPHGTNVGAFSEVWESLLASSPALGFTFDPTQLVLFSMDVRDFIQKYGDRIYNVHARDASLDIIRKRGSYAAAICPHSIEMPGMGTIPWREIVIELGRVGYCGPLCLEYDVYQFTKHDINTRIMFMKTCLDRFMALTEQRLRPPTLIHRAPVTPNDILQAAQAYRKCGWSVVPLMFRSKQSELQHWPTHEFLSEDSVREEFSVLRNVAIEFGSRSNNLVDIDLDHPLAVELAPQFLPPTGATFGRPSKPKSHYLYYVPDGVDSRYYTDPIWVAEIRSEHTYTVAPPSIHITGEPITWDQEDPHPGTVNSEVLLEAMSRLVEAVKAACDGRREDESVVGGVQ